MNTRAQKDQDDDDQFELDLDEPDQPVKQEKAKKPADDDFDVEVVDDVDEKDKPRLKADHKPDLPDDDEIEKYSEGVQKRIKQLKFEFHEADRRRQESDRIREEAVAYAKKVSEQNNLLSERYSSGQKTVIDSTKARFTSEMEKAKADYRSAYEAGDTDAVIDAQQRMIKAQSDLSRAEGWQPQKVQPSAMPENLARHANAPKQAELNSDQKAWYGENKWFGQDAEMTGAAYGLHESLVRNGVDPNSKTYYAKIDEGMRRRFPEKFESGAQEVDAPPKKTANVVAPANRSTSNPRKIKLTSTQVALAKRLGLDLKVYAAQMLKDAKNGQ